MCVGAHLVSGYLLAVSVVVVVVRKGEKWISPHFRVNTYNFQSGRKFKCVAIRIKYIGAKKALGKFGKMESLVRNVVYTLTVYLVLIEIAQPAWSELRNASSSSSPTTAAATTRKRREDRGRKANLVRKLMRKKPKDGNIRLMEGTNEHEGRK